MEDATLRGTVVGDGGAAVAGWVSLGPNQPQHWIARSFTIETFDGERVAIEGLESHTIEPVFRTKAKWGALQGSELANLCVREAPAPDIDVVLTSAVARGGEPLVVWGVVVERGDRITKLTAFAIGRGDGPEEALAEARLRYLDKQIQVAADKRRTAEVGENAKAKKAASSGHVAASWVLALVLVVIATAALAGYFAFVG